MKKTIGILLGICLFTSLLLLSQRDAPVVAETMSEVVNVVTQPTPISSVVPELTDNSELAFQELYTQKRKCVTDYMSKEVGLREKRNKNDHSRIDEYFRNIGFPHPEKMQGKAKAYCGAFMANAWLSCIEKIAFVKNNARLASVDGWRYDGKNFRVEKYEAQPADVVSFALHRHVEGVYERHPNPTFPFFTSIGGNTSAPPGDADTREGVHKKTRAWQEVNAVISFEKTLRLV